jgi:hypothetical protein
VTPLCALLDAMIFLTLAQVSKTAFQEKHNTIKIETTKQTFAMTERAQCFVYTIAKMSFYTMSQKNGTKNWTWYPS